MVSHYCTMVQSQYFFVKKEKEVHKPHVGRAVLNCSTAQGLVTDSLCQIRRVTRTYRQFSWSSLSFLAIYKHSLNSNVKMWRISRTWIKICMCLYELSTYIFFDILGFDGFKGVVCRIQHSEQNTVIKHTHTNSTYVTWFIFKKYYALVICKKTNKGWRTNSSTPNQYKFRYTDIKL